MKQDLSVTDNLALERTNLALERTLLAYIRTFLGFVASGAGLAILLERDLVVRIIGYVCIAIGIVFLVCGITRYAKEKRHIDTITE